MEILVKSVFRSRTGLLLSSGNQLAQLNMPFIPNLKLFRITLNEEASNYRQSASTLFEIDSHVQKLISAITIMSNNTL